VTVSEIHEEFKEFDYLSLKNPSNTKQTYVAIAKRCVQITILILIYILKFE